MSSILSEVGSFFDSIVKNPIEALIKDLEAAAPNSPEVAQAKQDVAYVANAAQAAQASTTAAVEAVVNPLIGTGVSAVAASVPIVGPLLSHEASAVATAATDAVIGGIIAVLESKLSTALAAVEKVL